MNRLLFLLALTLSFTAKADLHMAYNGFFARMKKVQQPQYSDITLTFALQGITSAESCRYYSLKLISDIHDVSLDTAANGEISLPYDEEMKNSNAILQVLQADNAEACQIQFRLRSKMRLPLNVDNNVMEHYRAQFDALLDDMAGLGRYWLPEVTGVIVQLHSQDSLTEMNKAASAVTDCKQLRCTVGLSQLNGKAASWQFSQRPHYVQPLISPSLVDND